MTSVSNTETVGTHSLVSRYDYSHNETFDDNLLSV